MGWQRSPHPTTSTDPDAIHDNVAAEIVAVTEKATPHDDDLVLIEDSQASNTKKRVKLSNLTGGGAGSGLPFWAASSPGAYDDTFSTNSESDWTVIPPDTGTATWAYTFGLDTSGYHCAFAGQNTTDLGAVVKSLSGIATGDYIQARFASAFQANIFAGVVLTDGTTSAANYAMAGYLQGVGYLGIDGTLTASNAGTTTFGVVAISPFWLRLVYSAANTFQMHVSLNGFNFSQVGTNIAHTMTPTHGGFAVAGQGDADVQLVHFSYFHSNVTP